MSTAYQPQQVALRRMLLQASNLSEAGIVHGFTTRHGGHSKAAYGTLNLSQRVGDERSAVLENRQRVLHELQAPNGRLVTVKQVHGAGVVEVTHLASKSIEADGIWTRDPEAVLGILVADCVPILMAHVSGEAVAAVHAGWRGTQQKIGHVMVKRLEDQGFSPQELLVALGPAIGPQAFEIAEDTSELLRQAYPHVPGALVPKATATAERKWHANLWQLNRESLLEAGIPAENIEILPWCTFSSEDFYSHRRDAGVTGRQGGLIRCGKRPPLLQS